MKNINTEKRNLNLLLLMITLKLIYLNYLRVEFSRLSQWFEVIKNRLIINIYAKIIYSRGTKIGWKEINSAK